MSLGRRIGRLERYAGMDADAMREADREARDLIAAEAIRRVSDEDLDVMAEMIGRRPDYEVEEVAVALREEYAEVWDRYEAIWLEVAGEMARGR